MEMRDTKSQKTVNRDGEPNNQYLGRRGRVSHLDAPDSTVDSAQRHPSLGSRPSGRLSQSEATLALVDSISVGRAGRPDPLKYLENFIPHMPGKPPSPEKWKVNCQMAYST